MSYVDPPVFVDQLKTQLLATAVWTGAGGVAAGIHFPSADADTTVYPCAILMQENIVKDRLWFGGSPQITSCDMKIMIFDKDTSVGLIEQFCNDIGDQICVDLGLANLSVTSITPSNEPSAKEEAEGTILIWDCTISLNWGLDL